LLMSSCNKCVLFLYLNSTNDKCCINPIETS
jgi:hypothetical protein